MSSAKNAPSEPKGQPAAKPAPKAAKPPIAELVSITVQADTGRIVTIESVDAAGARHELSEEIRARLTTDTAPATLEAIVEQAFEAGIDCVLGDPSTGAPESDEEAELSRLLLRALLVDSAAKRLVQPELLARAIIGTLIEQSAGLGAGPTTTAEGAATH